MTTCDSPGLPLTTRIPPENSPAHIGRQLLVNLAPPPFGEPCLRRAAGGMARALESTLALLGDPNENAKDVLASIAALREQLSNRADSSVVVEVDAALSGTKTRHPEWWCITRAEFQRTSGYAVQVFLGCAALVSIHQGKRLSRGACDVANQMMDVELAREQLLVCLNGEEPADFAGEVWPRQLRRLWIQVIKLYSSTPTPPSVGTSDRIASQILDGALAPTARKRGGAVSHRQLSQGQLQEFQNWSVKQLEVGSLEGCLAVLVSLSSFSVDLAAELPLTSGSAAQVDLQLGALVMDYSLVIHQAAEAAPGALPAGTTIWKPLPTILKSDLQERLKKNPNAQCIKDLFAGQQVPRPQDCIWTSPSAMPATWARLRHSSGTWLRFQRFNNLIASVMTGDFHHIPRSKLYYAWLDPDELAQAFTRWYQLNGWGDACIFPESKAFGCQVVHPGELLFQHDKFLLKDLTLSNPGKHCSQDRLIEHHNAFMRVCGFRLSLLLALRESTELEMFADVHEDSERFWAIEDKLTPGHVGASPQPIASFTRETLSAVRHHCSALAKRLSNAGHSQCTAAKWARAVVRHQPVRMLCIIEDPDSLRPLATRDFLTSKAADLYQLAPDFGRKTLENLTRQGGLKCTETDALLRHNVSGQSRLTSTSHTTPSSFFLSTSKVIDGIAKQLFEQVVFGLSKGDQA